MEANCNTTRVTLWVNRFIGLVLAALLFLLPTILDWYATVRDLSGSERTAILVAFYICAVIVGIALWQMDRLLLAIGRKEVFVAGNVRRVRIVRWCCAAVSLVCLPAAFIYYPLIFLVVIMAFLSLVMCVVVRVLDAAVTIREENDLTI